MKNKRLSCENKCQIVFNNNQNTLVQSNTFNLTNRIKRNGGVLTTIVRNDINNLGISEGSSMANLRTPPRNF